MYKVKPVQYKTVDEIKQAFMRSVNMRKVWETEMRQRILEMDANNPEVQNS